MIRFKLIHHILVSLISGIKIPILNFFHSYLIQTGRHRILVDACVGNDKERPYRASWHRAQFPFMQSLAQAGVSPEDIDFVCCTHMHADHVGWNTRLQNGQWVPTFPKARYVFAQTEYSHWEKTHREALAKGEPSPNHGSFADSVLPVVEAGRALMVQDDFELIGWDFVSNPSTHGAFMVPVNESVNRGLQQIGTDVCGDYCKAQDLMREIITEIA